MCLRCCLLQHITKIYRIVVLLWIKSKWYNNEAMEGIMIGFKPDHNNIGMILGS
jgi:hypothetical protein